VPAAAKLSTPTEDLRLPLLRKAVQEKNLPIWKLLMPEEVLLSRVRV
jgi:hypothetical protein